MRKLQNDRPNGENIMASMLAQFGPFQARKAPRSASAPTTVLLIAITGDAPLLLVGEVEVSDVLGLRAPELLPVFAPVVAEAGTVLRAQGTLMSPFSAQNQLAVLTEWPSPRWQ